MMKKVSIIVPLYKSEKFLHKLLDSIVQQSYNNLEIILIDDGSPDNSGFIAEKYAKKDSRIIVIHQNNSGTCAARNAGLDIAAGEYLMFADGDDWLELDCVEYLVNIMEQYDVEMVTTDAIFTTRDRKQNEEDTIRICSKEDSVAAIIDTFYIPVGPWNKLYTMKVIKDNNISFSVPWFGEGLYFSTMAAQFSNKMAIGHRKVYNYRLNNPNSGCTVREVSNALNSLSNIFFIRDSLKVSSKEIKHALDWHIWSNYFNLITYIVGSGDQTKYRNEFVDAKKHLWTYLLGTLTHKRLKIDNKVRIILRTFFPITFAKRGLRKTIEAFNNDTYE